MSHFCRYFETEITQDAHVLNADIERLEKEKIRLTILIRKLDARLKSLVTQVQGIHIKLPSGHNLKPETPSDFSEHLPTQCPCLCFLIHICFAGCHAYCAPV